MKNKTLNTIKRLGLALEKIPLIESLDRVRQHYDGPKFWYYSASISDKFLKQQGNHFNSSASGVSFFSQETAILKVLAEAIERYSNFAFFSDSVDFVGKYFEIRKRGIDPKEFVFFSDKQLSQKKYKDFLIKDDSVFRWTKINSLTDKDTYLVPCQAVYLSYKNIKGEPIIYPSISTGAAGHFSLDSAILNGIYEVLERDSFMIYYLNKLKPKKYDLLSSNNKEIQKLLKIAARYNMQVLSLDIKTDLDIPVVASVVLDRSGLSKAVSVGLKCHLDIEKAIIGSITEAFHTRTWIRESYIGNPKSMTKRMLLRDSSIRNRGLFWYSTESIPRLDFFTKNLETIKIINGNKNLSATKQLSILKNVLAAKGYKIYYKDITSKYFSELQFKVVKVIVPRMQPLYLNENYPLKEGDRLRNVPLGLGYKKVGVLNTYPHPFL